MTYSENYWANENTTRQHIINILLPYLEDKRKELKLSPTHRALVLFDNCKDQCTEEMFKLLDSNNINIVLIPPNCTDRLQPLDVSVNKSVKEFLRQKFHSWYAESVSTQLNGSVNCQLWTTTYYRPLIIPHTYSIIIISGNLFGLCLILCDSNEAVQQKYITKDQF